MVTLTQDNSAQTGKAYSRVVITDGVFSGILDNDTGPDVVFDGVDVLTYLMGSGNDTFVLSEPAPPLASADTALLSGSEEDLIYDMVASLSRMTSLVSPDDAVTADSDFLLIDGGQGTDYFYGDLTWMEGAVTLDDNGLIGGGVRVTNFEYYGVALGRGNDTVSLSMKRGGFIDLGEGDDSVSAVDSAYDRRDSQYFYGGAGDDSIAVDNSRLPGNTHAYVNLDANGIRGVLNEQNIGTTSFSGFETVSCGLRGGNSALWLTDDGTGFADTQFLSVATGGVGGTYLEVRFANAHAAVKFVDGVLTRDDMQVSKFDNFDLKLGLGNDTVSFSTNRFWGDIDLGGGDDSLSVVNRVTSDVYKGGDGFDRLVIDNSPVAAGHSSQVLVDGDRISGVVRYNNATLTRFDDFEWVDYRMGSGNDTLALNASAAATFASGALSLDGGQGSDNLSVDYSAQRHGNRVGLTLVDGLLTGRVNADDYEIRDDLFVAFSGFEQLTLLMGSGSDVVYIEDTVYIASDDAALMSGSGGFSVDDLVTKLDRLASGTGHADPVTFISVDGGGGRDSFGMDMTGMTSAIHVVDGSLTGGGLNVINFENYGLSLGSGNDTVSFSGRAFSGYIDLGAGNDSVSAVDRMNRETFNGGDGIDTLSIDNSSQVDDSVYSYVTVDQNGLTAILNKNSSFPIDISGFEFITYRMGGGNDRLFIDDVGGTSADSHFLSADGGGGEGFDYLRLRLSEASDTIDLAGDRLNTDTLGISGFEIQNVFAGKGDDTVTLSGVGYIGDIDLGEGDDHLVTVNRKSGEAFKGGEGFDRLAVDNSGRNTAEVASIGIVGSVLSGKLSNSYDSNSFTGFEVFNYRLGSGNDTVAISDSASGLSSPDDGMDLAARLEKLSAMMGDDAVTSDTAFLSIDGGSGIDSLNAVLAQVTEAISLYDGLLTGGGIKASGFERYDLTLGAGDDTVSYSSRGFSGDVDLGGGDDSLSAVDRAGREVFDGGDGFDHLIIDNALQIKGVSSTVRWDGAAGFSGDLYNAGGTYTRFAGFEAVSYRMGSGNDLFSLEVTALGSADSHLLSVDGGLGDDTLSLDLSDVDEGVNLEAWIFQGFENSRVYLGNGDDAISTGGGNDLIRTGNGNDLISGGGGGDTMAGGAGNDTYVVDDTSDKVVETANEGTDLILSSVTYSLAGRVVEHLTLTGAAAAGATGNNRGNRLTGNSGNNVLDGGGGNDSLAGGLGDDTYYVDAAGDKVFEAVGEGTDTVIASVTWSLSGVHAENLILTGSAALNATGNTLGNRLTGNSGSNVLDGGAGHDRLDGGAGADSLIGGTGNDTYVVDNAGDTVTEVAGVGVDLVEASVTYGLAAHVDQLTLTGTANVNGTGNTLDNVLTGNSGNNILSGGLGNDTYFVQNAGDKVVELGGEGTDVIYSTVSYSLNARYAETLILTGSASIHATGNSLANTLRGNDGNNTLNGKGGKDALTGGLGADIFLFEAGSGLDTVTDFSVAQNDMINVSAYTGGVASAGMVSQNGGDVVINLGGGNVVTVQNAVAGDVLAQMVW